MKTPASKTALLKCVKNLQVTQVINGLTQNPKLLAYRDDRGRNWLHLAAGVAVGSSKTKAGESVELVKALLALGFNIDEPAFREGSWQATPLWFAVARGNNRSVAEFLLDRGADPNHCLWAATYSENEPLLLLLINHGAPLDAVAEDETPLLHAVKYSRFRAASILLDAGCNPDFQDSKQRTALHYMLRKGSDVEHFRLFADHGARGDILDGDGQTAIEILSRKRDQSYREVAEKLRH